MSTFDIRPKWRLFLLTLPFSFCYSLLSFQSFWVFFLPSNAFLLYWIFFRASFLRRAASHSKECKFWERKKFSRRLERRSNKMLPLPRNHVYFALYMMIYGLLNSFLVLVPFIFSFFLCLLRSQNINRFELTLRIMGWGSLYHASQSETIGFHQVRSIYLLKDFSHIFAHLLFETFLCHPSPVVVYVNKRNPINQQFNKWEMWPKWPT